MTTTDRNIKDLVIESLGSEANEFNIEGIVDEYKATFGLTLSIEDDEFWAIVFHNAL